MKINEVTSIILEESIYIHRTVGPGLFKSGTAKSSTGNF